MDHIFSYNVFRGLEKNRAGVSGLAAFRSLGANIAFGQQTTPGSVEVVSGQYFPLLGVKPALGRVLTRGGRRRKRRQRRRHGQLRVLDRQIGR